MFDRRRCPARRISPDRDEKEEKEQGAEIARRLASRINPLLDLHPFNYRADYPTEDRSSGGKVPDGVSLSRILGPGFGISDFQLTIPRPERDIYSETDVPMVLVRRIRNGGRLIRVLQVVGHWSVSRDGRPSR